MKNIAIFGCKATTQFLLEELSKICKISHLVTIDSELARRNQVADYTDLSTVVKGLGIDSYVAKTYHLRDAEDIENINALALDIVFVVGWQRIIPDEILKQVSAGVFGMHGSSMDLPFGRGRSPLNWSILENRQFFYTNLFKYDAGVDSGDILDTFLFSIRGNDTAETMHFKNTVAMKRLIQKNLSNLLEGDFVLKKQGSGVPTYYPKREPSDSIIDWERDVFYLDRHIRAVTRPFNGAFTFHNEEKIIIYRATIFETDLVDFGYSKENPGKVVEVFPGGKFLVKCVGGTLLVHEYEASFMIFSGLRLGNASLSVRYFELNKYGNCDQ